MATTTKIADLTGPGLTDAYGVGGTDLGIVTTAPDGRLVAVFGDTFDNAGVGGPGWRSPVVLFADPSDFARGLRWTGSGGDARDYACQLVRHPKPGWMWKRRISTMLPADVITIGDTMYLHVMANRGLGNVLWSELLASTDNGVTWQRTGCEWPGNHYQGLFQQLTWCSGDDGYVYAYTTGFQRNAGLLLHRVPAGRITDPDAWEPWGFADERWAWGNPPTITIPGELGELNLRRVPGPAGQGEHRGRQPAEPGRPAGRGEHRGRQPAEPGRPAGRGEHRGRQPAEPAGRGEHWLLTFFNAGAYRIETLLLDKPNADLHRAPRTTVLTGCGWDEEDHAHGRVAQLYGGYVVPGSTLSDLHLVVSQWNTDRNWPYRSMQFRTDVSGLLG